jgi:hypothetical protein
MRKVWALGVLHLKPGVLQFYCWSKDFNPHNQTQMNAQVWVKLMHLPQEYWRKKTLFEIASGISTPLTLDEAAQCYLLEELPKNIDELINLKHLEIDGCLAIIHMPRKLYKMESSLQTLSLFVVSEGYNVGDLTGLARLNNLRGHLEISHLERSSLDDDDNYLKVKITFRFLC